MALGPASASATITGSVNVFPATSYTVGAAGATQIIVTNTSTDVPPQGNGDVTAIELRAACSSPLDDCAGDGALDPGSFSFGLGQGQNTGTGTIANCFGTWSINPTGPPGHFALIGPFGPNFPIGGEPAFQCTITFPATPLRLPAADPEPDPGIQTYFHASATFEGVNTMTAREFQQTTINPAPPAPAAPAPTAAPTGQRAAALAKCKKKKSKKKRKKCRRAALALPI